MNMRTCIFTKGLPIHNGAGGMEKHTEDLVKGLRNRGHDVTVITTKHPYFATGWRVKNDYYLRVKPLRYSDDFFNDSYKLFVKLHHEKPFDLVHSQSIAGYGAAKYCHQNGIPFVMTLHGIPINNIRSARRTGSLKLIAGSVLSYMENQSVLKYCLSVANRIVAVSDELLADCRREFPAYDEPMIKVIPNGVDTEFFKPLDASELREQLNIGESEQVIVTVGRIQKEKGIQRLINILPDLPQETKLVIVGEGSFLQTLKELTDGDDRVIFAGRVPYDVLPWYYNLADVVAFPTMRIEGMPIAVLEAISCGKVVVASRMGGIPSIITNFTNGGLCDPKDDGSLFSLVMAALILKKNADAEILEVEQNARKTALDKFALDTMVERYVALYDEVKR